MTAELSAPPELANTVAVLVTFHPDAGLAGRIAALESQVVRVVVVDNGSSEQLEVALGPCVALPWVEVIRNDANLGIGKALNQGLARARDLGMHWVLTLDQDTTPMPGLVAGASTVYRAFPDRDRLAVIGAESVRSRGPRSSGARLWTEAAVAITAGSVISLKSHEHIGPFREGFFIDYVDIEYCLRARRLGFRIVTRTTQTVQHQIGSPSSRVLLFRLVTPTNHSAVRRYYITRNRVRVWAEYGRAEPRFVVVDIASSVKELIKLCLFEDHKVDKVRNVGLGLWDGLRGRSGPLPGVPMTQAAPPEYRDSPR